MANRTRDLEKGKPRKDESLRASPVYNPVKHGIFCNVILGGEKLRESLSQYRRLLRSMRISLQPVGTLEEILVERMAMLMWRHRRLVQAEAAEILRTTEFLEQEREESDEATWPMRRTLADSTGQGLSASLFHATSLNATVHTLKRLADGIRARGLDPEEDTKMLEVIYGKDQFGRVPSLYRQIVQSPEARSPAPHPEGLRKHGRAIKRFLLVVGDEIRMFEALFQRARRQQDARTELLRCVKMLPEANFLERLHKYEAALERYFYRALDQLERLQRMRLGKPVAAPVKIELSA